MDILSDIHVRSLFIFSLPYCQDHLIYHVCYHWDIETRKHCGQIRLTQITDGRCEAQAICLWIHIQCLYPGGLLRGL